MKKLLPENVFSPEQLNSIKELARETQLTEQTCAILFGRGIDTKEKADRFFSAGEAHYISPFKMSGMREAVELITKARDEEWETVIYGDYDADGICSVTVMKEALLQYGVREENLGVYVPERRYGYGLRLEAIDRIFDDFCPQLVITVDCGISGKDEVRYIQEQGAEVIVTDHHELPSSLPDCIRINPKIEDDYIYDNLCGTGVAFKVGIALNGKSFYRFADIVAIATVADSVTLTGENRDIVTEGLKMMNKSPRRRYAKLLKSGDAVTSTAISYTLAPKLNAAGRMGDAGAAYDLISSDDGDDETIERLTEKLTKYNTERQERCDEVYRSAKEKLKNKGAYGRVIMLSDVGWGTGFVGIVAARLAEEFSRPVLLFTQNGESLNGSARSVEGVNIYEALRACSQHIDEFGGHAQAAGLHIHGDKFDALEDALNAYMEKAYPDGVFIPTIYVDGEVDGAFPKRIAKELEMFEPYGVGNKKPLFVLTSAANSVRPIKPLSPHLTMKVGECELTYFSGVKNSLILESDAKKELVFEYSIYEYYDKEYIRGIVRDVVYDRDAVFSCAREVDVNNLMTLAHEETGCNVRKISDEELDALIDSSGTYGTIFIAFSPETIKKYPKLERFPTEIFNQTFHNLLSMVLVSPCADTSLTGYKKIVLLDSLDAICLPALEGKDVYVCCNKAPMPCVLTKREDLVSVYRWIIANKYMMDGGSAEELSRVNSPIERRNMLFALLVFEELGIISYEGGKMKLNTKDKTDLTNSRLFRLMTESAGRKA
ncbi:MAG: single-stranded-DNA-specific exonuclease RecJ [Clostridia bacterium]|nr:single-stranded-DNA-specific exonuclease RecJ [Clostridia bacterium]